MTEEEAKTKWCPAARFKFASTSDNPASNREGGPDGARNPWLLEGTRCIASACMAWREDGSAEWYVVTFNDGSSEDWRWEPPAGYRAPKEGKDRLVERADPRSALHGYCGLAGSPQ